MKIFYIHGFGSFFKENGKVKTLLREHEVIGVTYDTTATPQENFEILSKASYDCDLIVGTSLGGWYAALVGTETGTPFVCINPAVNPQETLTKYIGNGVDYNNKPYTLTQDTVSQYETIRLDGRGMVLIDKADDVIDPNAIDALGHTFEVHKFDGGSHRFEHMEEALPLIQDFANRSLSLGFGEF